MSLKTLKTQLSGPYPTLDRRRQRERSVEMIDYHNSKIAFSSRGSLKTLLSQLRSLVFFERVAKNAKNATLRTPSRRSLDRALRLGKGPESCVFSVFSDLLEENAVAELR